MAEEKRVKLTSPAGGTVEVRESVVDRYLDAGFTRGQANKAASADAKTERKGEAEPKQEKQPTREASDVEKSDDAVKQAVTRKDAKS